MKRVHAGVATVLAAFEASGQTVHRIQLASGAQYIVRDGVRSLVQGTEPGFVYFARASDLVKIGFSGDVRARIRSLQTACPSPITLLATIPGTHETETKLHQRFASDRAHGEWFRQSAQLLAFLAGIEREAA